MIDTFSSTINLSEIQSSYGPQTIDNKSDCESIMDARSIFDDIPIEYISSLVGTPRTFMLSTKPSFPNESIIYKIIEYDFSNLGSIYKIANDNYIYHSNNSGLEWIKYIAIQNINTSSPTREVEIYRKIIMFRTYTQQMVNEIPRNFGSYIFENISFDGNTWKFGKISSDFFHSYTCQGPDVFFMRDSLNSIFQVGKLRFIKNESGISEPTLTQDDVDQAAGVVAMSNAASSDVSFNEPVTRRIRLNLGATNTTTTAMKNIAFVQRFNILTDEQIIKYMGNIQFLTSEDPEIIYKFIVDCNKKDGITNFCLNMTSGNLSKLSELIQNNRTLDNCIFVATHSNADYVRDIAAKNIYFSLSPLSVIVKDYTDIAENNIMTIISDDITNPFYEQLYLDGPKPSYRISELTVEKMNEFVDNGTALNLLIALTSSTVDEYKILNKILLDPNCKYTQFATFLEIELRDLNVVNKLTVKLDSITNIASNVSVNGLTELYPDINSITLYDNCLIQLVNNYNSWPNFIKSYIIYNKFSENPIIKEKKALSSRRNITNPTSTGSLSTSTTFKHTAKALVITCIDFRLIDEVVTYFNSISYQGDYDEFILAGASLGYNTNCNNIMKSLGARTENKTHWTDVLHNHMDISYNLHDISEIIVIDHMDCGAYKGELNNSQSYPNEYAEIKAHVEQLNTFREKINRKYPQTVKLFLMKLNGKVDINPTYWRPNLALNSINIDDIVVIGDGTISDLTVKGKIEEPLSTIRITDRVYVLYDSIESMNKDIHATGDEVPYILKNKNNIWYIQKKQNTSKPYYIRLEKKIQNQKNEPSLAYIAINISYSNSDAKYSFTQVDYFKD